MTTSSMSATTETTYTVVSQDGAKISYLTLGSGPSVLVIPGALSMAADYAPFARALAGRFTVHIIERRGRRERDRKSTRLNSSHANISYAVFCLKKKNKDQDVSMSLA